jgi:hypothetical protein
MKELTCYQAEQLGQRHAIGDFSFVGIWGLRFTYHMATKRILPAAADVAAIDRDILRLNQTCFNCGTEITTPVNERHICR